MQRAAVRTCFALRRRDTKYGTSIISASSPPAILGSNFEGKPIAKHYYLFRLLL